VLYPGELQFYNSFHPLTRGVFFISLYAAFGPRFFRTFYNRFISSHE